MLEILFIVVLIILFNIPKDWIEKLQRKDLIEECLF